ncbi:uncharacterized protein LOC127749737 [Frankliniella occidentalis]|uniref:Uncharacterized protein LOC127749737 n=1 Tax=Frankliniella occidentalis TaxID=133901 RepID=A0A9C6U2V9_FRAOC|nr:uncharacterized protein LOC127749737 [Frankliniella occidentalis]
MHMPKRCQKRFEALTAEYRNYSQEAERTGAEGPLEMIKSSETRKIMALMGEFWCNSVSIKPKVTIAAGVKAVTHHTEKQPSPTGRVRKLPSKKTDTRAERLLKCEEEKSGALKLMSESIALMMQNKRNQ